MKKRQIIPIVLLVLAACTPFIETGEVIGEAGLLTGTEGLALEFLQSSPPPVIYSPARDVPITIFVENKGTFSRVDTGQLYLSGFDPNIISVDRSKNLQEIPGRSTFQPRGLTVPIDFEADIKDLGAFNTDRYRTILLVLYFLLGGRRLVK